MVQSQLYGPESRGGASRSDVIISDDEIDYPEVEHPDVLFAFNQLSASRYAPNLKTGGTAIYDSSFVTDPPLLRVTPTRFPSPRPRGRRLDGT